MEDQSRDSLANHHYARKTKCHGQILLNRVIFFILQIHRRRHGEKGKGSNSKRSYSKYIINSNASATFHKAGQYSETKVRFNSFSKEATVFLLLDR